MKGDICQFHTFDLEAFQAHVSSEDLKLQFVRQSISIGNEKSCIKCGVQCDSWNKLFEHVTTYHSRPQEFPQFGDIEWKFLMTQGNLKRICSYCGQHFDNADQWILHMKVNIDDNEFKAEYPMGVEDLDQVSPDLKCLECQQEQVFKTIDALRIHTATFHKRNKRFLCAFCNFDGETVKDLNHHINSEHDGNFNKCLECDFSTWAHSVLRRHVNVRHRNMKTFGCKHCHFTAMSKTTLVSHIKREHAFDQEEEAKSSLAGAHSHFKCCFCDFYTPSKKAFQVRL